VRAKREVLHLVIETAEWRTRNNIFLFISVAKNNRDSVDRRKNEKQRERESRCDTLTTTPRSLTARLTVS
jgi:hypothetical protein